MSVVTMKSLLESGVHFGHQTKRWNPNMARFIFSERNGIHIIDLQKTSACIVEAYDAVRAQVKQGKSILFVGTKKQAQQTIETEAKRCGMPFVSDRWLGGTLTNFRTIRSRLGRLEELEALRAGDELATYSKKMQSALNREYRKMYRNLNGIRNLNRLPECLVVIDPKKEKNAIREAQKLGITTIALIDTNCDPDEVDLPIPGNDDSIRSIELITSFLADAVVSAKAAAGHLRQEENEGASEPATV